jgi:thioredoxin reductase (NADPH)
VIEIYTKQNCIYCMQAKTLLKVLGIEFTESRIGNNITRDEFVEKFPDARTVPHIVINGVSIGGYEQLKKLYA